MLDAGGNIGGSYRIPDSRREPKWLGRVDKRDSLSLLMHDSRLLFAESGFDSRADDGRGMGDLRAVPDREQIPRRSAAAGSPQGHGRHFVDDAHRLAMA